MLKRMRFPIDLGQRFQSHALAYKMLDPSAWFDMALAVRHSNKVAKQVCQGVGMRPSDGDAMSTCE